MNEPAVKVYQPYPGRWAAESTATGQRATGDSPGQARERLWQRVQDHREGVTYELLPGDPVRVETPLLRLA